MALASQEESNKNIEISFLTICQIKADLENYINRNSNIFGNFFNFDKGYKVLYDGSKLFERIIYELHLYKSYISEINLHRESIGSFNTVQQDWTLDLTEVNKFQAYFDNIKDNNNSGINENPRDVLDNIYKNILLVVERKNVSYRREIEQLKRQLLVRGKLTAKEISDRNLEIEKLDKESSRKIKLQEMELQIDPRIRLKSLESEDLKIEVEDKRKAAEIEANREIKMKQLETELRKLDVEDKKIDAEVKITDVKIAHEVRMKQLETDPAVLKQIIELRKLEIEEQKIAADLKKTELNFKNNSTKTNYYY